MLIAALDTSCGASLALQDDDTLCCQAELPLLGRNSDRQLVPWVLEALAGSGHRPADVRRWTVGTGPGSFSGIRVGVALVKGICAASGAQCRGLPSSLALAAQVAAEVSAGERVGVLHDARRGQIIVSIYTKTSDGLDLLCEPLVSDRERLVVACQECAALVTPQTAAVHQVLVLPDLCERVLGSRPDARHLLGPYAGPWPECPAAREDSTNPVYVRPAVFVTPRPQRPVVEA